ncbi:hypothetical protein KIW84_056589 [Lathyrus oleraceus]|uniref:DUF4283 domain-containing protein n=1 Tax=Pisum sativum TaxID=3888 RepID=A0A9D4X3N8_PEA|nr:hypothetical protein KIW84_056589 [Pisum sativum]
MFVKVISGKGTVFQQTNPKEGTPIILKFTSNEVELSRFHKAFIGVVENIDLTYRMQDIFHSEGYFSVKVTPLDTNLCMLEKLEDGDIKALIEEASSWLGQWFKKVRACQPKDVDSEKTTWNRCFGIPCQAWFFRIFEFLTSIIGTFICCDDNTIKITEETQGPIGFIARRVAATNSTSKEELVGSEDSSDRWEDENDRGTNFYVNSVEGGSNIRVIVDESRDLVSHVACPRLDEVSNPLNTCHLPDENVKLTKDFCGPWTLAYNKDNKVEESHTIKSVRPLVMDTEKLGPISFDDAY